jgi:BirA family transcriptional regulator, biotin operon repressor / biotin---[acetyl-CoA-carboxylase] ligase
MIDDLAPLLRTRAFGRRAEHHPSIDSTNRRALELAEAGAPAGMLVVADVQTAGRGRHGRAWLADPGLNLLCSVVLRPPLAADRLGLVTIASGVAVAEAVEPLVAPLAPALKWPNDVLLEGRKICGMLLEARHGAGPPAVVLGIGLNVNQVDFPAPLAETATSLRLETGRLIPRAALLAHLLERLETWSDRLADDGGSSAREAFHERMALREQTVHVRTVDGATVSGRALGVAEDGALRLATASGERRVHAGEVTLRTAEPA